MIRVVPARLLAALPLLLAPSMAACSLLGLMDGYADGELDASAQFDGSAFDASDAFTDESSTEDRDAADAPSSDVGPEAGCASGAEQPCYTGDPNTINEGVCHAGTQTCAQGTWGACVGEVVPSAEVCNTKDDNCDGTPDEGCYCTVGTKQVCGSDIGECKLGEQTCQADGSWGACVGDVGPVSEVCDGYDNNCNGTADEALQRTCYSSDPATIGQSACKAGVETCVGGSWGTCVGEVVPVVEECNNVDDDCDGKVDDGLTASCYMGPPGTEGVGICRPGAKTCTAGSWSACAGDVIPQVEACNGKDDNCDGTSDKAPDLRWGLGVTCAEQCLDPTTDQDCDGLGDVQDPWPAQCNTVLFSDPFFTKPGSPSWQVLGSDAWACGTETLNAGTTLRLAATSYLPPGPSYMAEARVTMGPASSQPSWRIALSTADSSAQSQWRTCEIWYYETLLATDAGPATGPSLYSAVNKGATALTDWVHGFAVDAPEGAQFRVQSYGTGTEHHCRLLSADGGTVLAQLHHTSVASFTVPGTVQVTTAGRSASLDYVRVFSVP